MMRLACLLAISGAALAAEPDPTPSLEPPFHLLSGPEETLESHLMVFAAEKARRENCVVKL